MLVGIERLIEPLKQTCNAKVKSNSVKQEFEKQDELKRSALRAVIALQRVPDADKNQQLSDFIGHIKANSDLAALYSTVQKDSSGGSSSGGLIIAGGDPRMMEI